jgi:CO/xanthine dehydrogenase Mo-binding subunit
MVLTREESLRVHAKRHPALMRFKTGADREGRVLAIEADIRSRRQAHFPQDDCC